MASSPPDLQARSTWKRDERALINRDEEGNPESFECKVCGRTIEKPRDFMKHECGE